MSTNLKLTYSPSEGDDYDGIDQVITFSQSVLRADIDITIRGDQSLEPSEEFFGRLETADDDVVLSPNRTTIQIVDTGSEWFLSSRL